MKFIIVYTLRTYLLVSGHPNKVYSAYVMHYVLEENGLVL